MPVCIHLNFRIRGIYSQAISGFTVVEEPGIFLRIITLLIHEWLSDAYAGS
jgi:hypothetical protein